MPTARAWGSVLVAALALAGCGGGDGESELSAEERACVERFNADRNALEQGEHFYDEHGSRQALVFLSEPGRGIGAPKKGKACAIIFAAFEGDDEYGTVGVTEIKFGWTSMAELGRGRPDVDLFEIQRRAASEHNAEVFPDGQISD